VRELAAKVQSCSPLGDYAAPLAAVRQLVSVEPIAKVQPLGCALQQRALAVKLCAVRGSDPSWQTMQFV
jgi:hypothetical protein